MAKLMVTPDPFVAALLDALGLPKRTRSFELRCAAGEAVTVKCEYYPDADTASGFDPQPLLAEYRLVQVEPFSEPSQSAEQCNTNQMELLRAMSGA